MKPTPDEIYIRLENMDLMLHVERVKNYNSMGPGDSVWAQETACIVGHTAGNG
jgi:hypothetical protein